MNNVTKPSEDRLAAIDKIWNAIGFLRGVGIGASLNDNARAELNACLDRVTVLLDLRSNPGINT